MTRRGMIMLLFAVWAAAMVPHLPPRARPAAAADQGPCALLSASAPQSAACDAEIAAHPLPALDHPVQYEAGRDGEALPRSVLLPGDPLPYPLAWQRRAWYFSDAPGVYPADNDYTEARRIPRQTMFYVYRALEVNREAWYLIGVGRWMRADFVSVLQIPARPEGVSGQWIALDLNQQTLVALVDDTPLFATLICSGYYLETTPGLFHIYGRTLSMIMRGPPGADPPLYEFPTRYVMFFNGNQGLHAMRSHNNYGMKRTHGCVNVPPGDEEWLWNWVSSTEAEWDPSGTGDFAVDFPERAPWVYVYNSPALPAWEGW